MRVARIRASTIAAGLLAGLFAIAPLAAQTEAPRQRSPGVPLAPDPAETTRRGADLPATGEPGETAPNRQAQRREPQPRRDPPMPKPVPSIIQN